MANKSVSILDNMSFTPSTRKLMKSRAGKGLGMLSPEEIVLLRESKKEIAEACQRMRMSLAKQKNGLC